MSHPNSPGNPFNRRPPSDTPMVSAMGSPQTLGGDVTPITDPIPPIDGSNSIRRVASTTSASASASQRRATTLDVPGLTRSRVSPDGNIPDRDIESKLVIIMVGLPARGKSYVTKKLCRYLNWQQHGARIFNVGNTRRQASQSVGPAPRPLPDDTQDELQRSKLDELKAEYDEEAVGDHIDPDYHHPHHRKASSTSHGADFFSPDNEDTFKLREKWAMDTLDQLLDYVLHEGGSVGILDATNTTVARRRKVRDRICERTDGRIKVLFLESICTRSEIIDENVRLKLSGPDYKHVDREVALKDFLNRLRNYEKVYETISEEEEKDDDFQYIKMIDVGKKVVCYNIQGFLAGQAVFFLLNFNLAERQIWITRHGESQDNAAGRIGGDAPLTPRGRKFSATLSRFMEYQKTEFRRRQLDRYAHHVQILRKNGSQPTTPLNEPDEPHFCVWSSMLQRSVETSQYFDEDRFDVKEMRMLNELGAGICDGMTYAEIAKKFPHEYRSRIQDKIRYRYPGIGGESYLDVINRLRPVIVEMERMTDNALIIAHRVVARVLLAYFMNLGRDAIGDLDVPLHTLYVLEPKPYGVDWAIYEYDEDRDWFFKLPQSRLPPAVDGAMSPASRSSTSSLPLETKFEDHMTLDGSTRTGEKAARNPVQLMPKSRQYSVFATDPKLAEDIKGLSVDEEAVDP